MKPTTTPSKHFDMVSRSVILCGEKPTKGLDAALAPNENQMNRVTAYLADGAKVVVAERPGKGGMDFNKLLGDKVFAVAADAFSPVFEKGEDKKPTKIQKKEDDLPLYSSNGFYSLSSRDYPALKLLESYTKLVSKGEKVLLLTPEQLQAKQTMALTSDIDMDLLGVAMAAALADENNLVAGYDTAINKKRKRGVEGAQRDAEDNSEEYTGVQFTELAVSKKDGNPFLLFAWQVEDGPVQSGTLLREYEGTDDDDRIVTLYDSADEAIARFTESAAVREINAAIDAGKTVTFAFAQGHVMRTSVSFRRKVENFNAAKVKPLYGDAVYIRDALENWVTGLVSVMYSKHPNFPQKDYDANHYVVACRQAEVGMMKKLEGGWLPPEALAYDIPGALLK